jgi:hypothetical protein
MEGNKGIFIANAIKNTIIKVFELINQSKYITNTKSSEKTNINKEKLQIT